MAEKTDKVPEFVDELKSRQEALLSKYDPRLHSEDLIGSRFKCYFKISEGDIAAQSIMASITAVDFFMGKDPHGSLDAFYLHLSYPQSGGRQFNGAVLNSDGCSMDMKELDGKINLCPAFVQIGLLQLQVSVKLATP